MKVLVVGSGAREHTLVWKIAQSPRVSEVFAAPGNAGMAQHGTLLDIRATDFPALNKAVQQKRIDVVVVGPEDPLAAGIVDYFKKAGVPVFGPTQVAAQLEASKVFSKGLMQKYGIPCAKSLSFSDFESANAHVTKSPPPFWIKTDGLAAGKGAVYAGSVDEAIGVLKSMMLSKAFGASGERVVVEEQLTGREMSSFAITDGTSFVRLASACDHKRVFDGDQGPNTGGMGCYSPPVFETPALSEKVDRLVMEPVVKAMQKEGRLYQGVMYGGLMIKDGNPSVIEFNARFGDPECQVILPRMKTDIMDLIMGVVEGTLGTVKPQFDDEACVGVAMASGGYPGKYETGKPISGLQDVDTDIVVFHAATKRSPDGQLVTNGGRVLTVVGKGKTLKEAREKVYDNTSRIHFDGAHYRTDIALIR